MVSQKIPGPGPLTREPLRTLYTIYMAATSLLALPIALPYRYFIRQDSRYTFQDAAETMVAKWFMIWFANIEKPSPISLDPGKEGNRFIVIDTPKAEPTGVLKDDVIKPGKVGAVWYPAKPDLTEADSDVVLHFHGGAYVMLSARTDDQFGASSRIVSKVFNAPVLCPEYRLASARDCYFPAQLQDAVAAYTYLIRERGIAPASIYLSGDSAGGHLVLSLLRYLIEEAPIDLPLPAGAMLWSPWVNLENEKSESENPNSGKDIIAENLTQWGIRSLTNNTIPRSHPHISPHGSPFKIDVPIFVNASSTEFLYFQVQEFVEGMRKTGTPVKYHDSGAHGHDIYTRAELRLGEKFEKALVEARKFFEDKRTSMNL